MSTDHGKPGDGVDESAGAHLVPGLVAVQVDDPLGAGREAIDGLAELVHGRRAEPDSLREMLGPDDETPFDRVSDLVGLISVETDPRVAAAGISVTGVAASPVHALGYQWHKVYSELPLGDEVKFDHDTMATDHEGRVIAVVDSGLAPGRLPAWVGDNVEVESIDLENDFDEASHGTFVASILRQVAPSHQVYLARAGRYRGGVMRGPSGTHDAEPTPTTEAHVAAAILRLIDRLGSKGAPPVDALNISLGGPSDEIPRRAMILLSAAIDRWRKIFPTATVFAASGNSTDRRRVYPAAFPEVRAVSGCNDAGRPVAWLDEYGDPLVPDSPRATRRRRWVNDIAPGVGLVGLTGKGDQMREWSGSSFATAIASGGYAAGRPETVSSGVSRWALP